MTRMTSSERKTGVQGATVAANVERLMEEQNFNSNSLARKIADIEQPTETANGEQVKTSKLSALAIRRIVAGERKVDVDDLVLLAYALGVAPVTLLQPHTENGADEVVNPLGKISSGKFWHWLTGRSKYGEHRWGTGNDPLSTDDRKWEMEQRMHIMHAVPGWSLESAEAMLRDSTVYEDEFVDE